MKNRFLRKSSIGFILSLVFLFSCNTMAVVDYSLMPHEGFSLKYVSTGSQMPVSSELHLNSDGSYVYIKTYFGNYAPAEYGDKNVKLEGLFDEAKMNEIVDAIINRFDFFNLSGNAKEKTGIMDASTQSVTVQYKGKTRKISAYAASEIPEYGELVKYLDELVAGLNK